MAQPNYSYFNPVLPSTPVFSTRHSRTATSSQPSASGWDSPIPGPSWNIGGSDSYDDDTHDIDVVSMTNPVSQSSAPATITSSSLLDTIQPLDLSSTTTFNLSDPGTASTSEDSNIYRNFLESLNLAQTSSGSSQAPAPESSVEPTSKLNPVICSDSDSDSDAVMIVDYEKPWLERSPIHLSTDNSSDCDILITGTSNMAPDKRAKRKMKTGEVMSDMITLPSESVILEKQGKKRKHRSRSNHHQGNTEKAKVLYQLKKKSQGHNHHCFCILIFLSIRTNFQNTIEGKKRSQSTNQTESITIHTGLLRIQVADQKSTGKDQFLLQVQMESMFRLGHISINHVQEWK